MKLIDAVQDFLYTHAPTAPYRQQLLQLIRVAENAYLVKIAELEKELSDRDLSKQFKALLDDTTDPKNGDFDGCTCKEGRKCRFCSPSKTIRFEKNDTDVRYDTKLDEEFAQAVRGIP